MISEKHKVHPVNDFTLKTPTIGELIRWGVSCFESAELTYGHGTDNAGDEALAAVFWALHLPFHLPEYIYHTRVNDSEAQRVLDVFLNRVESRKPLAYITGEAWFAGLKFDVNEHVLVPRSPIAEMISHGFAPWVDISQCERVLDLGTGSGAIALAIAHYFPHLMVDAVDQSAQALEVAKQNVERLALQDQVNLHHGSWYKPLTERVKYDLIISNPPYVPTQSYARLSAEYMHEPKEGLIAGEDGLDDVRAICDGASAHLASSGCLIIEMGEAAEAFEAWFDDKPYDWAEFEHGGDGVAVIYADAWAL